MPRRPLVEPTSRLAIWGLRLVLAGMAVMLVAILAARTDRLDGYQAVIALALGLAIVATGILLAVLGGIVIWVTGYGGARQATLAVVLGLAVSAYPLGLMAMGLRLPALNDVTSDLADPPTFGIAAMARPTNANPVAYPTAFAPVQRRVYPEIRGIDVDLPADSVNEIVNDLVESRRWTVLDQVDYRGPDREGRVEMVTRSLLLGFRDDIVIRIRSVNGRARIDMRSASRYGRQDFGENARRTIAALDEMRVAARRAQRER